jgi:hypothetical protein
MKKIIFILCICMATANAQDNTIKFADEPKWILKFAPRVLAPKITYECMIDDNSSYGFDARIHALWLPQAIRLEGFYRRYFNDNGPMGFYIQPKAALGYFDYNIVNLRTNGLQAGGGFNVGGQFNIGKKNAVVDVYGGLQWIAPIYFNMAPNSNAPGLANSGYNAIHYTLIAFPIDIGVRFGFIKMRKVPIHQDFEKDGYY